MYKGRKLKIHVLRVIVFFAIFTPSRINKFSRLRRFILTVRRYFWRINGKNMKKHLCDLRGENNLIAFCPKKILDQPAAVICEHIGYDFNAMI